jgi:hypothetical protein
MARETRMNTGLFALSTVNPRNSMAALHAPCGILRDDST